MKSAKFRIYGIPTGRVVSQNRKVKDDRCTKIHYKLSRILRKSITFGCILRDILRIITGYSSYRFPIFLFTFFFGIYIHYYKIFICASLKKI